MLPRRQAHSLFTLEVVEILVRFGGAGRVHQVADREPRATACLPASRPRHDAVEHALTISGSRRPGK